MYFVFSATPESLTAAAAHGNAENRFFIGFKSFHFHGNIPTH
ncbi:hypothetical protein AQPE_4583 [Aquipluma nitroreducens]|uniref:Uncharacterized protein n=1 Tax=Aquipluma nitroreducens TaxID=2010828 RepID=A0A5K7SFM6_9BACT|nr:hypothetical protein AQPE_4583 [Aquipluma nitroreducens]